MQQFRSSEGLDEWENKIFQRSSRQCVACRGDLAVSDKPRLYFLPSPWTHFLAPGLGQRKKQQPPRKGEGQKRRNETNREQGERESRGDIGRKRSGGEKKQQLDSPSELKTGANPFCFVQHYPLPLLSPSLPLRPQLHRGTFSRQWFSFVKTCSRKYEQKTLQTHRLEQV